MLPFPEDQRSMQSKTITERAFKLAQDADCQSLRDIKRILSLENYGNVKAHLASPTLRKQLIALLRLADLS